MTAWKAAPCYIYRVRGMIDGGTYVGISRRPYARLTQHARADSPLGRAIRAQRLENFQLEILFAGSEDECRRREPEMIRDHRATYNIHHAAPLLLDRSSIAPTPSMLYPPYELAIAYAKWKAVVPMPVYADRREQEDPFFGQLAAMAEAYDRSRPDQPSGAI